MSTHHPSAGADIAAAKFRAQRIAQVTAPERVHGHLAVALDIVEHMDNFNLHDLALVLIHCTKAVCTALDGRT